MDTESEEDTGIAENTGNEVGRTEFFEVKSR